MARFGYSLCVAGVVILSGAAEPQIRLPQTNDRIVLPDGSGSWVPARRKDKDPLTYELPPRAEDAPEVTASPLPSAGDAQPVDAGIATSLPPQCGPVAYTPEFGVLVVDAQQQLKQGNFAAVISAADIAEKFAVGSNEKLTIASLRVTAYRKMNDRRGLLTSMDHFLELVSCGFTPEARDAFKFEMQKLRDELKSEPQ